MRLFLEIVFCAVTMGVLPILINKSTEIHLDWVRRWLRELWFGIFVFFIVYWIGTKPEITEGVVDLHKHLEGPLGYVLVGTSGLIFFCGFWWFTGRIANAPKVASAKQITTALQGEKEHSPQSPPLTQTQTDKSSTDLHVQDEDERRKAIIEQLRQEFVITHRDQEGEAIAKGAPLPADWENRRLWSIGEQWRIGVPDSIASLTSIKLSRETQGLTEALRQAQQKYLKKSEVNSEKWWKQSVDAHMLKDFSHDQDRHDRELQELAELQTEMAQDFENNYRVKARQLRDEILCRIPVQPALSQDFIEIQAGLAIDRHSVAGSPLGVVADYLDRIASQLPPDSKAPTK